VKQWNGTIRDYRNSREVGVKRKLVVFRAGLWSISRNTAIWLGLTLSLFLAGLLLDQVRYCHWAGWIVMNAAGLVLVAGFVGMLVEMGLIIAGGVDYMKHR
jgi:hypothetical protein